MSIVNERDKQEAHERKVREIICPTNSPKPKGLSFTITNDKEKLQILTFKKLKSPTLNNYSIIKIVVNNSND